MMATMKTGFDMSYRTDLGYLQRIPWRDGTPGYCRRCDTTVPFSAKGKMLVCPEGHETHPVNLLVNGQIAR